ncbi:MAG: DUF4339 domain-containing protein [Verrucomicrobiota bacterium]
MNFYYTDQAGEVVGPVSRAQLQQFVDADVLPPTTQVCYEGSQEWQPIAAYIQRTTKPATKAQPILSQKAPLQKAVISAPTSASPMKLFVAVFVAIVVAGGCLMGGWYFFLQDKAPKPFTISTPTKPAAGEALFERKGELSGEAFIVTKGGQNYKLGLVPIALYSLETLKPHLDQKRQEAQSELTRLKPLMQAAKSDMDAKHNAERTAFDAYLRVNYSDPNKNALDAAHKEAGKQWETATSAYYSLLGQQSRLVSGAFYFSGLPEPLAKTQTNSDGRFTIEMPTKGKFAVAANAHRSVGDSTERYYWLISIALDGAAKKTTMLSNNNLTSEDAPDSLIFTSN